MEETDNKSLPAAPVDTPEPKQTDTKEPVETDSPPFIESLPNVTPGTNQYVWYTMFADADSTRLL